MGARRSPPPLPADPALPAARALLDPEALVGLLDGVGGVHGVDDVRVRYLEYAPGRSMLVQVRVTAQGAEHDAVASTGRLDSPARLTLAWFPVDPGLPALRNGLDGLLGAFGHHGGAAQVLAWVAHQRLVVRQGDVVVKAHSTPAEAALAVDRLARAAGSVPTPRVLAERLDIGAYALEFVRTAGTLDALDDAPEAAQVLRRLHTGESASGLDPFGPSALLELCAPVVELVAFAMPVVAADLQAVMDRLEAARPAAALVSSHGDFNIGQLVRAASGTVHVVDTDTLCRAPAALDVASYVANVISGRSDDVERALEVEERLLGAYGSRPDGYDWYRSAMVVRRADRAIRRWKTRWPERTGRLVETAAAFAKLL